MAAEQLSGWGKVDTPDSRQATYGQARALWEIHRRHYGRDDAPILVWQATAPEMSSTLDAD